LHDHVYRRNSLKGCSIRLYSNLVSKTVSQKLSYNMIGFINDLETIGTARITIR
jgi:hypothetical protein